MKLSTLDDLPVGISSLEESVEFRRNAYLQNETFVLTNGCLDLLHAGHIYCLEQASALGSHLWIALNSDSSVRTIKGSSRPVQVARERAYALLSLKTVSGVFLFDGRRISSEIKALSPDAYAKSGDYCLQTMDQSERESLEHVGSEIHFLPFLKGCGTTGLLQKIKDLPDTN